MRRDVLCLSPRTLDEALQLRYAHPQARVLAGGTDLLVQLHAAGPAAAAAVAGGILNLWGVAELRQHTLDVRGLRLGALLTFAHLLDLPELRAGWPLLAEAAAGVGAEQIRQRATLGGNLVNASPAGDSLPPLLVHDARLELASVRGRRTVPVEQFYRGYKQLDLAPDELLVAIELPRPTAGRIWRYRKVGTRRAQAITKVSVACGAALLAPPTASAPPQLGDVRLACGAVGPTVSRLRGAERLLEQGPLTAERIEAVRRQVEAEVHPIDDVRSTADYRRLTTGRLVARFLTDLTTGWERSR